MYAIFSSLRGPICVWGPAYYSGDVGGSLSGGQSNRTLDVFD